MVTLEPGAQEGNHGVLIILVCLARWFIWKTISGAQYGRSCDCALRAALLDVYICKVFYPAWSWSSLATIVLVVCSSCRVRGIPNVIDNMSMGIVKQLLYASMICMELCTAFK